MKKSSFTFSKEINITPEQAWKIIGAVNGVDKWVGPITACSVDGDKRVCATEEGSFEEDILKIDHENRVFKYGIPKQHMVPVSNIIGQMSVTNGTNNHAIVTWTWNFDVTEENEAVAKETFNMLGTMGIDGIEQLVLSEAA